VPAAPQCFLVGWCLASTTAYNLQSNRGPGFSSDFTGLGLYSIQSCAPCPLPLWLWEHEAISTIDQHLRNATPFDRILGPDGDQKWKWKCFATPFLGGEHAKQQDDTTLLICSFVFSFSLFLASWNSFAS